MHGHFFVNNLGDLISYRDYFKDGRGAGKEVSSSGVDVSTKKAKPVCLVIINVGITLSLCSPLGVIAFGWLSKFYVGLRKCFPGLACKRACTYLFIHFFS